MKIGKKKLLGIVCVTVILVISYVVYDARQSVIKFYTAAQLGDAPTQTSLGKYYYQGYPFPKDYAKAMKWWQRAANQGYAEAQFDLGHMYWFGEGATKDLVKSDMWMTLAAEQNYKKAADNIKELEHSMTPNQIDEAKRLAKEWRREHMMKVVVPS